MKYPCLIQKQFCKTPIKVIVSSEDISEDGAPIELLNFEGECNFQDGAKQVMTVAKQLVTISGVALIPGDIAPKIAVISAGEVWILGEKRNLYQGTKSRNPDGSVNFTRLELD